MKWLLLLLAIPFVSADVIIYQVLYDPVGTESGGEAVELKNTGSAPVDVSGWVIASESSATDVTLPNNAVIPAGQTYLVADANWDTKKDNSQWRSADYEETMTLGNADSGIALKSNSSVIDAVGWGDEEEINAGLWEGSPASPATAGHALVRTSETNDNSADFTSMPADFFDGIPVIINANVSISLPAFEISPRLDLSPNGNLIIKNNGEETITLELLFNDLRYKNYTISKEAIEAEDTIIVEPESEMRVPVKLNAPKSAVAGKYTSILRVRIS